MVVESAVENEGSRGRWLERVVSAVLGIAVAVIAALVIGAFQTREPHLTYSSTDSVPFSGSNQEVSIYQVTLSNDGKKEVYEVASDIRIPYAKIDQLKLTADPLLAAAGTVSGDTLNVRVPSLNPSESVQVSVLASGSGTLPTRPQVTARGRGVVSSEKSKATIEKSWADTLPFMAIVAATLSLASAGIFQRIFRSKSPASARRSLDQREALAHLCWAFGLTDLANKYADRAQETSYWQEADRLGQAAVDGGGERLIKIEQVLLSLVDFRGDVLQRASKAAVYYNLAIISQAQNNELDVKKYLRLARDASKDEVESRLKFDPRLKGQNGGVV